MLLRWRPLAKAECFEAQNWTAKHVSLHRTIARHVLHVQHMKEEQAKCAQLPSSHEHFNKQCHGTVLLRCRAFGQAKILLGKKLHHHGMAARTKQRQSFAYCKSSYHVLHVKKIKQTSSISISLCVLLSQMNPVLYFQIVNLVQLVNCFVSERSQANYQYINFIMCFTLTNGIQRWTSKLLISYKWWIALEETPHRLSESSCHPWKHGWYTNLNH